MLSAPGIVPAWAVAQTAAIPETPGVPGSAMLQMLLGLAFIIGLLLVGAYLLRRINGGRTFGNTGPLRLVGGLMLSPRERIVLLEIGETWVVVGVVPGQIKTLYTLPKGELPDGKDAENRFSVWLKHVAERKNERL
jgi:flagellar protein FliO/FliZ